MSDRDDLGFTRHHGEHKTRRDTERVTYERARSVGMSRDEARRTARKISEDVHRRQE